MQKIILASQSPRRKQILEWAEIDFEMIAPETDESFPAHLNFEEAAIHIAYNKVTAVSATANITIPILAADTIVVCNDQIIGKPKNKEDAVSILQMLSGNMHKVITGVCIYFNDQVITFSDITTVEFNTLALEQIEYYINKYKPYDKAGAYAIQEWIGVIGIKSIDGDFYNVMGLPINRVVSALKNLNI